MFLSHDDLLKLEIDTEVLPLPRGKGHVRVRGLNESEADEYRRSLMRRVKQPNGTFALEPAEENANARLAVLGVINEDGTLMFRPEEYVNLAQMPADIVLAIANKVGELSGLAGASEDDELGKSETTPNSPSTSSSPGTSDAQ